MPATAADVAKSVTRSAVASMPIDAAAVSLPWIARKNRPVVPLRIKITPKPTTAKIAKMSRKKERSVVAKSGRGTWIPFVPLEISGRLKTTFSTMSPKAKVASVR